MAVRKRVFTERVAKRSNKLPRDVVESLPLENLKGMKIWHPGTWFTGRFSDFLLTVDLVIFQVFSNLNDAMILSCVLTEVNPKSLP